VLDLAVTSVQVLTANLTLILQPGAVIENVLGTWKDDRISGNDADSLIVGNAGNDQLMGRNGRDILIGGTGLDILNGGNDDDLLIAGRTLYDLAVVSLYSVQDIWTSAETYQTRISTLRTSIDNPVWRRKVTVLKDTGTDILTGGGGQDWYFKAIDDVISDLFTDETFELL